MKFIKARRYILSVILFCIVQLILVAQNTKEYKYPLFPFTKDLSQTLTFKIMLRCALPTDISNINMQHVLEYIKQLDCITRGIPKIVILGGFQQDGHDHQYPWWLPVDDSLVAPNGMKGKNALIWLMTEARQYNTHCTFHVNPFDAYEDSPMWRYYVEKDLICRREDGSLVTGKKWWKRQSYMVNLAKEWESGVTKQKIDTFLSTLPLIEETGVLYWDNITQYPDSPFHNIKSEDQIEAIKKCAEYLKNKYGIQLVAEYADPRLYGFLSQGITWDWNESLSVNQMEIPAYFMCGGRDVAHDTLLGNLNLKPHLQVFGTSLQLEDIQFQYHLDRVVREFTHHTLAYFYLNRFLREKYVHRDGYYKLTLSDNIISEYKNGKHQIVQNGILLKDGYDVFLPVYWQNHLEIMAYSLKGGNYKWAFPENWKGITAVDIYTFNKKYDGLQIVEIQHPLSENEISIDMLAGQPLLIVPFGTDMNNNKTIYSEPSLGSVKFIGIDYQTHGNWVDKFGTMGYDIFGWKSFNSTAVDLHYIGDSLIVYDRKSRNTNALVLKDKVGERIQAVRTSKLHQLIDLNIQNENLYKVSLYFADYKKSNSQMLIEVIDPRTKKVLHSNIINNFCDGIYLSYAIKGHVQIRQTRLFYNHYKASGYPVCSAVFIDRLDSLASIKN